jgi:hypothetical protein
MSAKGQKTILQSILPFKDSMIISSVQNLMT